MQVYHLLPGQGLDGLVLRQADTPRPGPGQVLVKMRAASLNYRDLRVAEGQYALGSVPENLVPLSDGAGDVVDIGPEVTRVQPGDRVAALFLQHWLGGEFEEAFGISALGGSCHGVLSEYAVFDQNGLVQLPAHLSYEEGATLPCAGTTAWNALFGGPAVKPGETVLTLGTGGVSLFALQFAKMAGARVIATSSNPAKLDYALQLGADEGIDYTASPEWHEQVMALTGWRGVDHVVEVVGGENVGQSVEATRNGGTVHLIGAQAGGLIDPTRVRRRNVTLRGLYVGSRAHFEAMNRAMAQHALKPVIDRVFPFDEAKAAYRHLAARAHMGKVVITLGDKA
ncbi:NAD(P)-dependent alcohol dehydrogenase [Billgrantia pellis]|uniref:NAD(P)-dependent alcohol dehydrogenase n=1 Tax=Billgrantia pellis TaxID=2606936 RepID=A0A7V7KG92_9GAMM|nr:NAD(P)-dependent alcohol dehydrogenase [Halomonas pellis]KAA0010045.1 NAD(P)-dependent alcohol dehydrogenase [Halomonas pellis]